MRNKICLECGLEIPAERRSNAKFCCEACQRLYWGKKQYKGNCERVVGYSNRHYESSNIKVRYKCKCAICGWVATEESITTKRGTQLARGNELHHIVPISEGGANDASNLILLCPNHHKQADLEIISKEELRTYLIKPANEAEKIEMIRCANDRISSVLFGEGTQQ